MRRPVVVLVTCLVVLAGAVPAVAIATGEAQSPASVEADEPSILTFSSLSNDSATDEVRILSLYPNPVTADDRGEFVVVRVPDGAAESNLTLTDGETTVPVPSAPGVVALSTAPARTRNLTSRPVHAVSKLALANDGERVALRRNGRVVDTLAYDNAPEGERLVRTSNDSTAWRPLGYDPRSPRAFGPGEATAFVLPDSPQLVRETLAGADERILLAGYTFSSRRVADALVAAHRRGVDVRVLVEGEPVGGISTRQAAVLDSLVTSGVSVRVLGGSRARFRYHHAKYAVVDDSALVLTENWKPAGTGGRDSRGWGVRVDSPAVATDLVDLFRSDTGWRDTTPWEQFREGRRFVDSDAANGTYPSTIPPRRVAVEDVRVLTAPGNAEGSVVAMIDGAERRVDVIQPTISRDGPFLRAVVRAAERGVRVRILLSDAWYVAGENRRLTAWLNDHADRRGLPLEARVADPRSRYGKIHAKGMVVDDTAVVGSMNWNPTSARENREVVLALEGEDVARYYRRAFEDDWRGGGSKLPVGLALGVVAAVGLAILVARRTVEFECPGAPTGDLRPVEPTGSETEAKRFDN